jgi:sulfur-oxidizing protein SoxY
LKTRAPQTLSGWFAPTFDPAPVANAMPSVDWKRREAVVRGILLAALAGSGLAGSRHALAAVDSTAFGAVTMKEVLSALGGTPAPHPGIELTLPDITENGALVPVSVASRLKRTEEISIVVESNPFPLVVRFEISADTEPYISTRVRLAQSGSVLAVVKSEGKMYSAIRQTKVTIGGCGG